MQWLYIIPSERDCSSARSGSCRRLQDGRGRVHYRDMAQLRCFRYRIPALLAAASLAGGQTGIKEKKPVFGGVCRLCPWGAMAEVVQAAMKPYGYDVQICYNCNAADAPRIVSEARVPPPI